MRIEALSREEVATAARSRLYRLLVQGFSYPDRGFFAALAGDVFRREVQEACQELPFALDLPLEGLTAEGDYIDFQADYLRVFEVGVGSPPCPLYSGLYRGGRKAVMEELTRFYNYFGLSLERGRGELPDHLTTELEFMHFLAFKELWALHHGQDPSPYRRAQVDFLERQLLPWLPQLQARVESLQAERSPEPSTPSQVKGPLRRGPRGEALALPPFYRSLIAVSLAFVAADAAHLRSTLSGDGGLLPVERVSHRAAGGEQ